MIKIGLYVNTTVWRWELKDNADYRDLFMLIVTVGKRLSTALSAYFPTHFSKGRTWS